MKKSAVVLLLLCLGAAIAAHAQSAESATARTFSITAGGMASGFYPNDGSSQAYGPGTDHLIGLGTYVDVHFTHWVQVEAEGRWLRLDESAGEHQDHYLIGPKVPIHQFGRAGLYGKALIGIGKMTFPNNYGYGSFTAFAFGGGIDYKLSRRVTLRAVDFEFQDWPNFLSSTSLYPLGVSVGMAYKVF